MSVKFFCPQFWGRKWLRQFYGRLEKCTLSAGKTQVHKIPRFGGGGVLGFGGAGGECRFYFYGREDFSDFLLMVEDRFVLFYLRFPRPEIEFCLLCLVRLTVPAL